MSSSPRELAAVLGESRAEAGDILSLAQELEVNLPGTKAAFRSGILSRRKAMIIAEATALLDPAGGPGRRGDGAGPGRVADPARAAGRDHPRGHGGRAGQGEEAP